MNSEIISNLLNKNCLLMICNYGNLEFLEEELNKLYSIDKDLYTDVTNVLDGLVLVRSYTIEDMVADNSNVYFKYKKLLEVDDSCGHYSCGVTIDESKSEDANAYVCKHIDMCIKDDIEAWQFYRKFANAYKSAVDDALPLLVDILLNYGVLTADESCVDFDKPDEPTDLDQ